MSTDRWISPGYARSIGAAIGVTEAVAVGPGLEPGPEFAPAPEFAPGPVLAASAANGDNTQQIANEARICFIKITVDVKFRPGILRPASIEVSCFVQPRAADPFIIQFEVSAPNALTGAHHEAVVDFGARHATRDGGLEKTNLIEIFGIVIDRMAGQLFQRSAFLARLPRTSDLHTEHAAVMQESNVLCVTVLAAPAKPADAGRREATLPRAD